jgi:hypothetical protein
MFLKALYPTIHDEIIPLNKIDDIVVAVSKLKIYDIQNIADIIKYGIVLQLNIFNASIISWVLGFSIFL